MQGWIHADLSTVQPQTFLPRVCKLEGGAETFRKSAKARDPWWEGSSRVSSLPL